MSDDPTVNERKRKVESELATLFEGPVVSWVAVVEYLNEGGETVLGYRSSDMTSYHMLGMLRFVSLGVEGNAVDGFEPWEDEA